jgi:hypothetical protein
MKLLQALLLVLVWQGCEVSETDTAEVTYPPPVYVCELKDETECDAGKEPNDAEAVGTVDASSP